jgi:hypothetical protein
VTPRGNQSGGKNNTIAFRVEASMLAAIDEECARLRISRGELVRAIVAVHFEACPAQLLERVDRLDAQLKRLSRNQVRALVTLLTQIGALSLDQAKDIVRSNLIS